MISNIVQRSLGYFRLLNIASGAEIVDFCGSLRPPPIAKPIGKGTGRRPSRFPMGFTVGLGRVDPQNRGLLARKHYQATSSIDSRPLRHFVASVVFLAHRAAVAFRVGAGALLVHGFCFGGWITR